MIFSSTVPRPECEAVIVSVFDGTDVSWPITSEARAYDLAKRIGVFGFWRLKARISANLQRQPPEP